VFGMGKNSAKSTTPYEKFYSKGKSNRRQLEKRVGPKNPGASMSIFKLEERITGKEMNPPIKGGNWGHI